MKHWLRLAWKEFKHDVRGLLELGAILGLVALLFYVSYLVTGEI